MSLNIHCGFSFFFKKSSICIDMCIEEARKTLAENYANVKTLFTNRSLVLPTKERDVDAAYEAACNAITLEYGTMKKGNGVYSVLISDVTKKRKLRQMVKLITESFAKKVYHLDLTRITTEEEELVDIRRAAAKQERDQQFINAPEVRMVVSKNDPELTALLLAA
jgi:hypothetical protein